MEIFADLLLALGAFGAGAYCLILGRRLNRFNDLEKGVGGAVAVLSVQVDDLNKSLVSAQETAATSAKTLTELTERAEDMSRRLELQMASLHDIPQDKEPEAPSREEPLEPPKPSTTPMFSRRVQSINPEEAV